MNLPKAIADLVKAQNELDSIAYANCFSETAEVFDEGKKYIGKQQIEMWIDKSNQQYKAEMKPLDYSPTSQTLEAEISGSFPGSPVKLTYQFEFKDGAIQSLKIV